MIFCKKCGSMMMPKQEKKRKIFICQCGETVEDATVTFTEEGNKEIENVEVADEPNVNPLIDAVCPKCKHGRAHYWTIQMRGADEPESRFFKCEKCGHTWREK
ncbi:transcription factor S [Candidatus Woesearchaeota archaeon]|nr:transcription factor S [Candidatus Woesearchaeota archaeon]